jgi:hypothetical protein
MKRDYIERFAMQVTEHHLHQLGTELLALLDEAGEDNTEAVRRKLRTLPRTRDGASVTEGMRVYAHTKTSGKVEPLTVVLEGRAVGEVFKTARSVQPSFVNLVLSSCYSTREAAEAAAKGGE